MDDLENRVTKVETDIKIIDERSMDAKRHAINAMEFARIIGDQLSSSTAQTTRYIHEISVSMSTIRQAMRKGEIQNVIIMAMIGAVLVGLFLSWFH